MLANSAPGRRAGGRNQGSNSRSVGPLCRGWPGSPAHLTPTKRTWPQRWRLESKCYLSQDRYSAEGSTGPSRLSQKIGL